MIDNYEKTMALIQKMETALPIPVIATKGFLNIVRQNNIRIPGDHDFQIEKVHYLGDEGGICCGVSLPEGSEEALVVSLTHLRVYPGHPLAKEIKSYQKKRVKKLAKQRW